MKLTSPSTIDKRGPSSPQCGDFIEVEERRRVFWMTYFLDHVITMRDDWPITLSEHVVSGAIPTDSYRTLEGRTSLKNLAAPSNTDCSGTQPPPGRSSGRSPWKCTWHAHRLSPAGQPDWWDPPGMGWYPPMGGRRMRRTAKGRRKACWWRNCGILIDPKC
jgi:hypothetical protein